MAMQTVSVSRTITADAAAVREAMADLEPFMQAGGFSEATADDDEIYLRQNLGLGRIELHLDVVDDPDAELAYEQREGIFDEMRTRYELDAVEAGTQVTATTEFELGGVVGPVLDATIVKRKRRSELNAQFDWLEDAVGRD
jgi:hypothetical protein